MSTVRSLGIAALLTAGLVMVVCASDRTQQPPGEYIDDRVVINKVEVALGAGFGNLADPSDAGAGYTR